jgi:pyruvate formate lyase activating enzyme
MKPEIIKGELIGKYITVEEAIQIARKDEAFFRKSGGGITLTGGEPLLQPDFATELLRAAKAIYLDTAIETCGYTSWDTFGKVLPYTDTFLFDIKNLNAEEHSRQTGQPNELIIANLRRLAALRSDTIILRTPIIPGENDNSENLLSIAKLANQLNLKRWDILPYHRFGEEKYKELGRTYLLSGLQEPTRAMLDQITSMIKPVFPRVFINNN